MDYTKLAKVQTQKVTDSVDKNEILDALRKRRAARKKAIADAQNRKEQNTKRFAKFKVTDSYKTLKKKIKDALEDTETTEEAVEAALAELDSESETAEVLAAVVEVLAEVIDQVSEGEETEEEEIEEPEDEFVEEEYEEIKDSLKHEEVVVSLLKNRKSGKFNWDSDGTLTHKGKKLGKVTYKDFTKKCEKLDELVDNALEDEK